MQKTFDLNESAGHGEAGFRKVLVHDSPYFKILNLNIKAGREFPVHSHDDHGQLSIVVLEGRGAFLGPEGREFPARPGAVLLSDIREPHGVRADTDLRILVTIAPPI